MGFFDSKSKTESKAYETGQQVTDNAAAFSLSGVKTGGGDISVSTTDHDAIQASLQNVDSVLEYGAGATLAVLESNAAARDDVLQYGAEVTSAALEQSEAARRDALEFGAGAFQAASAAQSAAVSAANSSARQVAQVSADSRRDALEFGAGAFEAAISAGDRAAEIQEAAFNSALVVNQDALDKIEAASQSDTRKLSEQMVYAVIALVGLMAWRATR